MSDEYKRDKIIRKVGDSVGVIFNKEERELYDINVNDAVSIAVKKKKGETQE
jgi:hypothetical protein